MVKIIVMFEYKGLFVVNLILLRLELYKENIDLKVYKNNIIRCVVINVGFDVLELLLIGFLVVVILYDDVVVLVKIINEFVKKNKMVVIIFGVIEVKVVD